FLVQSLLGDELERQAKERSGLAQLQEGSRRAGTGEPMLKSARTEPRPPRITEGRSALAGLLRKFGHADVRWHLWIALAILGRLEVALVAYAVYYPARAVAGALRKGAQYA